MKCTVLKNFPYSANGIDVIDAVTGTEANIPDGLVSGLAHEGFIKPHGSYAKRLYGSTSLPAEFKFGDGVLVMSTVVAEVFEQSGMDVSAWNALSSADRDLLLETKVREMFAALEPTQSANEVAQTPPSAPAAAQAPATPSTTPTAPPAAPTAPPAAPAAALPPTS